MNKEKYKQIIDEAYKKYWDENSDAEKSFVYEGALIEARRMTKDEFVDFVRTDALIAEKWGLKFEERELSLEERVRLTINTPEYRNYSEQQWKEYIETTSVPKRAITITYNNTKTEVYE